MQFRFYFILLFLILVLSEAKTQSKLSFTPGVFYNGGFLREYAGGVGCILGLEYTPHQNHFFALEMRTRYGVYSFDDGSGWTEDNDGGWNPPIRDKARLEYRLFSPQIGIVPKFYFHFDETVSLFIENEFSGGLMMGRFKYGGIPSVHKNYTESIFYYCIDGGIEYRNNSNWSLLGSIGYSTLNFKSKIEKHQPSGYRGEIPNQETIIMINMIFKIKLGKK